MKISSGYLKHNALGSYERVRHRMRDRILGDQIKELRLDRTVRRTKKLTKERTENPEKEKTHRSLMLLGPKIVMGFQR